MVLERSVEQHAKICIENSEDVYDALALAKILDSDIDNRIASYAKCISRSTYNFLKWLKDDYKLKLNLKQIFLNSSFSTLLFNNTNSLYISCSLESSIAFLLSKYLYTAFLLLSKSFFVFRLHSKFLQLY